MAAAVSAAAIYTERDGKKHRVQKIAWSSKGEFYVSAAGASAGTPKAKGAAARAASQSAKLSSRVSSASKKHSAPAKLRAPKRGDVYRDRDTRINGERLLTVRAILDDVAHCDVSMNAEATNRKVKIKLKRLASRDYERVV